MRSEFGGRGGRGVLGGGASCPSAKHCHAQYTQTRVSVSQPTITVEVKSHS